VLEQAGLDCPAGPLTAAVVRNGAATGVPYARSAAAIAVLVPDPDAGTLVGLATPDQYEVTPGQNLAGEPRDDVRVTGSVTVQSAPAGLTAETLQARGALLRAIQLVGASQRVLDLSVSYATTRQQFGQAISRFQAVQQLLALMAAEVAAAGAAVEAALLAPTPERIAAAKVRAGQAAGVVAEHGHQVHGAIGFTEEHQLHRSTLRLWSWRDEFGNEQRHARALGQAVLAAGPDDFWPWLVDEETANA
jgi:acyl-CoA dehydrogenase